MAEEVTIRINEQISTVAVDRDTPLLYVLANELGLRGPRFGCGLGQCGSCSVLLDGMEIRPPLHRYHSETDNDFNGLVTLPLAHSGFRCYMNGIFRNAAAPIGPDRH